MNAPLTPNQHKELLAIREALAFRLDAGLDEDSVYPEAHYTAALRSVDALLAKQREAYLTPERDTTADCYFCCGTGREASHEHAKPCHECDGTGQGRPR